MKYIFKIKIKMSHFNEVKKIFNKVSEDIEKWTGDKMSMDAFVPLATCTVKSPTKIKTEDLEKIRKMIEETTQKWLKTSFFLLT